MLSRADLVEMDDAELMATAECHGIAVEGLSRDEVFSVFGDFLDSFSTWQEWAE